MKRKYLVASILLIAIPSILLLTQFAINIDSEKALSTIDYSNTYATISTLYQRKTFQFNGTYWLFYCNGTSLFYVCSSDGLNWQTPTAIAPGLSASDMSVWFDKGTVYFTSTGGLDVPVIFRKGQINGDEILWENDQPIVSASPTSEYYNAYSTIDSDGRPWVSFMSSENDFPKTWYTVQVTRADSPTAEHWDSAMQVSNASLIPLRPCLVPLLETQIYAVFFSQNGVEGRLWDGQNWQETETITTRHPLKDFSYSAVSLNGEVNLSFIENATNNLYHYRRLADGKWQETIISAKSDNVAAVLSKDPTEKTLYYIWIQGDNLHIKKMANGNWSDGANENLVLTSPVALSVFNDVSDRKLGVALLEETLRNPLIYRLRYFVVRNP